RQRAARHAAAVTDDGRRRPRRNVLRRSRGLELARAAETRELPRPDAAAFERDDAQPRRVPVAETDGADDAARAHVEPAIARAAFEHVPRVARAARLDLAHAEHGAARDFEAARNDGAAVRRVVTEQVL